MVQEENLENGSLIEDAEEGSDHGEPGGRKAWRYVCGPVRWFKMLASEMHWSFVFGVVSTYGVSQGLGGSLSRVATDYYMKDVQKIQPSESQALTAITKIPWIVKPIWGILTDVLPILGYRRRPYFVLAGLLGIISMLFISLHHLHLFLALLLLTAGSTGVAVADVTIDACVANNSIKHPALAPDMQSLCALSSSIGALVGFSLSGVFVHLIGPKGVFGLLTIPSALVCSAGIMLREHRLSEFSYTQVNQKFIDAAKSMWTTLNCPDVWRPCFYIFMSLALSLDIHEGLFYWFTDSEDGPLFSQETVGFIFSIGSIGSILGASLYQLTLKEHPFRGLLLWTQLLFGVSGMLDLIIVLRLNMKLGIPDYIFIVIDESVSKLIVRLKWMPLLVLSSKLCPSGIEGTFFALLMSIDNFGGMTSAWGGGLLLHVLNVTRTQFDNLWLAILVRNIMRVSPLCLLFLVPREDPQRALLTEEDDDEGAESNNVELVSLVQVADGVGRYDRE